MANIKFTQLNPVTQLADVDVFAISDIDGEVSRKITFDNLTKTIVENALFSDGVLSTDQPSNLTKLITELNNVPSPNNLNATSLYHDGSYQSGSYFLDYNNFQNTPNVAVDISDLENSTGYLKYRAETRDIVWGNRPNGGDVLMTTDNVSEGITPTSNKYYTDARVKTFFDNNFLDYYSQVTSTFDSGSVIDSALGVPATFQNVLDNQSNVLLISDISLINRFSSGDVLRIYGGSILSDVETIETDFPFYSATVAKTGFSEAPDNTLTLEYSTALFDLEDGKITESVEAGSVTLTISNANAAESVEAAFNKNNFVTLDFQNVPEGKGILIYRKKSTENNYKLVSVLGTKDFSIGSWIDYYTFDYTPWSGKNPLDNTYVLADNSTNCIHFPVFAQSSPRYGWSDITISSNGIRDNQDGTFSITLASSLYVNSDDASCEVCHNDTGKIQSSINSNSTLGLKSVRLNAKTYVTDKLSIPDNFGLEGTPSITKLVKLPWSGGSTSQSKILETQTRDGAEQIVFSGIDIDGQVANQILFTDNTNISRNYAVDFGDNSVQIVLDNVRINDVVGGGIYAPFCNTLKLNNSEIRNSGSTDRYVYSPLIANNGSFILVTTSIFENYTDYVDVSVSNRGTVSNNIVSNCGSGLFIYGSQFFLSSQNVLSGPANEFLPTPDVYNSEYDSVNIVLQINQQFTSDVYKYQENGFNFDLTQNVKNNIVYELFKLEKSSTTGSENLYEQITAVSLNNIADVAVDASIGEFQFRITESDVNTIFQNYGYDTLLASNPDHIGLVYRASLVEYVNAGSITGPGTVVPATGDYRINVVDVKYLSVGAEVELVGHSGFNTNPTQITGTITAVSSPGGTGTASVDIDFGTVSSIGTGGVINIINKFTLAQGRILQ